jgi:phosphate-selective porin OprO/OprP
MRFPSFFLAMALLAGLSAAVWAQPPAGELADLRSRIEALERENQRLSQTFVERLPPAGTTVEPAGSGYVSSTPQFGFGSDDERVRSIVEQYLQERTPQMVSAESTAPADVDAAAAGTEVGQDLTMSARWNNGLELATKDKAFRVHVGGRWQMDTSWLTAEQEVQNNLPGGVQYHDGLDFRRARLRIDGTMYEVIEFAMEYDFVNGFREQNGTAFTDVNITGLTDMWLQYSHTPIGNIRVGTQKEAIGFEHLVSSRFLPFMERSYNHDTFYGAFNGGFTPGASVWDNFADERAGYNIGIFKPTNNSFGFNDNDGDYAVVGRLAWLPVYEDEGRQLIHLGISGRQATTFDDRNRFRTRDAMRAGSSSRWPVPADISVFGDTMQWVNAEFAAVQGPWTVQAEWLMSFTSDAQRIAGGSPVGPNVDSLFYQGGYAQVLYYLTGESDNYSFDKMAFDRVKPFENFFWVPGEDGCNYCGRGAWQVGARYNFLDLNDEGINGGQLHNLTLGLNWFFNPNTKWQFNYIATYRDVNETADFPDGSGWINGWGFRFAQDF